MLRWIIFLSVFLVMDIYAFQAFKNVAKSNWFQILYWLITFLVIGNFVYHYYGFSRSDGFSHNHAFAFGFLIALAVPKMILFVIMFGEDIFRVPQAIFRYFTEGDTAKGSYQERIKE